MVGPGPRGPNVPFFSFFSGFFNLIKSITSNHQTARAAKFSKMDLISLLILEPGYLHSTPYLPSRKKEFQVNSTADGRQSDGSIYLSLFLKLFALEYCSTCNVSIRIPWNNHQFVNDIGSFVT